MDILDIINTLSNALYYWRFWAGFLSGFLPVLLLDTFWPAADVALYAWCWVQGGLFGAQWHARARPRHYRWQQWPAWTVLAAYLLLGATWVFVMTVIEARWHMALLPAVPLVLWLGQWLTGGLLPALLRQLGRLLALLAGGWLTHWLMMR